MLFTVLLPDPDQIAEKLQADPRVRITFMLEEQVEVQVALLMTHRVQQIGEMLPQLLFHKGILDRVQRFQIDLPQQPSGQIFPQKPGGDVLSAEGFAKKTVMRVDYIAHLSRSITGRRATACRARKCPVLRLVGAKDFSPLHYPVPKPVNTNQQ